MLGGEIPPECPTMHIAAALGLKEVIKILGHRSCNFKGMSSHGNTALDLITTILECLRMKGNTSDERLCRWRIALSGCEILLSGAEKSRYLEASDVEIPDTLRFPIMGYRWLRRTTSATTLSGRRR